MKQIGMKGIFNSISIVALALLSLYQVQLAFAQLNTFEAGQPIRASEMNHNFEVVQEQINEISTSSITDAGCSATQQENSVLIECSDGTSGVIAGAGTVVVYPEGTIGEAPPSILPAGEVVWVDANGVVLAKVFRRGISNYVNFGLNNLGYEVVGHLINLDESQEVVVSAFAQAGIYYLEADCSGTPFSYSTNFTTSLLDVDGRFYTQSARVTDGTLMRGIRRSGTYHLGVYTPTTECEEIEQVVSTFSLSEFTPAPEILNAAYPVRLEQLP